MRRILAATATRLRRCASVSRLPEWSGGDTGVLRSSSWSHHDSRQQPWTASARGDASAAIAVAAALLAAVSTQQQSRCSISDDVEIEPSGSGKFDAARWAETLSRIKGGIVSLNVTSVRAFDTHAAGTAQATGFVVDSKMGLVLTNRHVVTSGPVVAQALFDNHEEVEVVALYRDPVHDFGVFKYAPAALKHTPRVAELKLRPDKAAQGLDVRVIGNNAGEKLSVLGAMLARLDREAPTYGRRTYNDFNTFYFQAASATSGGSSGSPVVDSDGDVVALNAAGKAGTSASFYLPLDRVKRAVDLIREGRPVSRGTLETTFVFTPFFELSRLGLSEEEAQAAHAAGETVGMLVVKIVVPGGPASGVLEPGDILLSVRGTAVTRFTPLEAVLDDAVGEELELALERGGRRLEVKVRVEDLHDITPHEYLECGDAVFNNLSYQLARQNNLAVRGQGVYVAAHGYMLRQAGVSTGSLITQVGDRPTRDVHDLEAALVAHPDGALVPVYFTHTSNPVQFSAAMMRIDRTWFPMALTRRDSPELGAWSVTTSPPPPSQSQGSMGGKVRFAPGLTPVEEKLSRSLATVTVSVPLPIDGNSSSEYIGTGLVVDAAKGLIICDRNTAPGALCDCLITFGSSCTVPAEVAYLHPLHNLAVLQYDPSLVGGEVESAQLKRCGVQDLRGAKLWHVTSVGSMQSGCSLASEQATVTDAEPPVAPPSTPPRWQETNIDLLSLKGGMSMSAQDGVVANDEGEVVAYWASFMTQSAQNGRLVDSQYYAGITADTIEDMLEPFRRGEPPPILHTLGIEMEKLGLAAVRGVLMDAATTDEVEASCTHWPPRVLSVRRRWAGTSAGQVLQDSDLVLEVDGKRVETFRDVEVAVAHKEEAQLLLVRRGERLTLTVRTIPLTEGVTERIVTWSGAVLQVPPIAIALQRGQPRCGVYVSSRFHGSPAATYGLPPMSRIVEVDGVPTPDLDSLLRVVVAKRDGDAVRIKRLDLRGAPSMTSLRLDAKYWPTTEIRRVPDSQPDSDSDSGARPGTVRRWRWRRSEVNFDSDTQEVRFHDVSLDPSA